MSSFEPTRAERKRLQKENMEWPVALVQVPPAAWAALRNDTKFPPAQIWRSRGFLVQIFQEPEGIERLSVIRTIHLGTEGWADNITWDELQRLKAECGRGHRWALEVYPKESEIVNVTNMRHIWVLPVGQAPGFAWRIKSDG